MLIKTKEISATQPEHLKTDQVVSIHTQQNECFIGSPADILKKHIGEIPKDKNTHFVTLGRWSMHDLIFYCLKQTGPAHLLVASWSISEQAVRTFVKKQAEGEILSVRFLLDPRVKVRNPKPLQMLQANFTHAFKACHAKVTTIQNSNWQLSIIASANLTQNPRIERGVICPGTDVVEFDNNWITNEIESGANRRN